MNETHDPTDIRGQRLAAQRLEEARNLQLMERADDVKRLMASPWGRRLMWGMLADAKTYQPTFDTNAMRMAHNEGLRSFGISLLSYIQMTCPERYLEMLKEQTKK
jgi:hypothetical protein